MTTEDEIREALAALRAEYSAELPGEIRALGEVLAEARRGGWDKAIVRKAVSLAHRLHGTAGSYRFLGVSEAAGRIEDALVGVEAGWLAPADAWPELERALADAEAAQQKADVQEG